jgi:hypothetical protein
MTVGSKEPAAISKVLPDGTADTAAVFCVIQNRNINCESAWQTPRRRASSRVAEEGEKHKI